MGNISVPSPSIPLAGMGMNMHMEPIAPERMKHATPHIMFPFLPSFRMRIDDATISTNGVSLSMPSSAPFSITYWSGTDSTIATEHPTRLPIAAALTAAMPLPCRTMRCPGRMETASSASGAPMNTDGTKSMNEWTTDADMMQQHTTAETYSGSTSPDKADSIAGYDTSMMDASVLTWIPGTSPVNVPRDAPMIDEMMTKDTMAGSTGCVPFRGSIKGAPCGNSYSRITGLPSTTPTRNRLLTGTPRRPSTERMSFDLS